MYRVVGVSLFSGLLSTIASAQYIGQYSANPYLGPPAIAAPSIQAPRLYNDSGQFRGNLSPNQYDPNSVNNPYGRYGSPYSQDSINNPYGQGSPYRSDSPNNPYGRGLGVYR